LPVMCFILRQTMKY